MDIHDIKLNTTTRFTDDQKWEALSFAVGDLMSGALFNFGENLLDRAAEGQKFASRNDYNETLKSHMILNGDAKNVVMKTARYLMDKVNTFSQLNEQFGEVGGNGWIEKLDENSPIAGFIGRTIDALPDFMDDEGNMIEERSGVTKEAVKKIATEGVEHFYRKLCVEAKRSISERSSGEGIQR